MSSEGYQPIQGMSDLAPPSVRVWQDIERKARAVFDAYDFNEIRTPILEKTKVFQRSLGDTTDVVQKEMYTFKDRGDRSLSLRPEGTASVMRFIAGAGPDFADARLYYMGPMFRCERPQAGRKRQFHQIGVEALGPACPAVDAEVIALQMHLLSVWGLQNCSLQINTRGLPSDRKAVADGLRAALEPRKDTLCEDCRRRMDTNVLRVLDCKEAACGAIVDTLPPMSDFMSSESQEYLAEVLGCLENLEIPVSLNPRLVRGLDYYAQTVWEITSPALGAQDALSGGGRYEIVVGSKNIEGVGFAMGIERVIMALEADGVQDLGEEVDLIWIVSVGDAALAENVKLAQALRHRGVRCGMDLRGRSMKAQMRAANRARATRVVIRGDAEMEKGTFLLKNMEDSAQEELEMPELIKRVSGTTSPAKE